ncbi:MAG: hypothetical protein PHD58_01065, partial [Anaerolineales bacterium]|nr:hypothetical protein [Anaerolineales bacterium]
MNPSISPLRPGRLVSRDTYTTLVRNALSVREFRFARLAALNWLSSYDGDLPMRLLYSKALLGEDHLESAYHSLLGLTLADPEYLEAFQARLQVEMLLHKNPARPKARDSRASATVAEETMADTLGCLVTLTRAERAIEVKFPVQASQWCQDLKGARRRLLQSVKAPQEAERLMEQAEESMLEVLALKSSLPLVAVTHLEIQRALVAHDMAPSLALRNLAEHYHAQFPECIQVTLIVAESLVDGGEPERAVSLLHQAAAQDVAGQVVQRLWGREHPYRNLWPDSMEAPLDMAIPAAVAATLGLNQLPQAGTSPIRPAGSQPSPVVVGASGEIDDSQPEELNRAALVADDILTEALETDAPPAISEEAPVVPEDFDPQAIQASDITVEAGQPAADEPLSLSLDLEDEEQQDSPSQAELPETLHEVQRDLEKLARRLHQPKLLQQDGRFPVYVVMSSRAGLEAAYGAQNADLLEAEMLTLVQAFEGNKKWHALLFYADGGEVKPKQSLKIPAVGGKPNDPNRLRQALINLDAALKKQGQMIGAVLIVGSAEVVPFHQLSNPVDDEDLFIPSDNPYGTSGDNPLAPQWPVGRLPGGEEAGQASGDGLARALQRVAQWHRTAKRRQSQRWYQALVQGLIERLPLLHNGNGKPRYTQTSFGYTAAAWRFASFSVFRVIGDPKLMRISPALQDAWKPHQEASKGKVTPRRKNHARQAKDGTASPQAREAERGSLPAARLGYFNLHGTAEDAEWFGHSDPTEEGFESSAGVEYPIALKPEDIGAQGQAAPQIVFSEACFSANIQGKTAQNAMCLSFLEKGCQAFVGSTCIAYGSLNAPLSAADYLSYAFWGAIREGYPAGEALRLAKLNLQEA